MPSLIIKPIQIKSFAEDMTLNLPWIIGLELDDDDNVNKYLYSYKNWIWNGKEDLYINRDGVLDKYDFKILNSWNDDVGEQYIYNPSKKLELLEEIKSLLLKEKSMPEFAKNWFKKLTILIEKSIELKNSTIIVGFEVQQAQPVNTGVKDNGDTN